MIILVGDTHGVFYVFERLKDILPEPQIKGDNITVIQVGDFGIWPGWEKTWKETPWPVYFIDGNHEHFPTIKGWTDSVNNEKRSIEVLKNLYYVPRGTVMEIDGTRFGFMGGGNSIDYKWRTLGKNWFLEESVQRHEVEELAREQLDVLVTHVPPHAMIKNKFPPLNLAEWGLDNWDDVSADYINWLWKELKEPRTYCGHMHKKVQWKTCRILDENECLVFDEDRSVWK